jgi:hypothetical protein
MTASMSELQKMNSPIQHPTGDPKVDAAEQDVITNTDESNKVVNTDDAVADMDGIESTLSEDRSLPPPLMPTATLPIARKLMVMSLL